MTSYRRRSSALCESCRAVPSTGRVRVAGKRFRVCDRCALVAGVTSSRRRAA